MKKLLNLFFPFIFVAYAQAETSFTATPDETVLSQEDSLSVKFQVKADSSFSGERPSYNAAQFEEINEYSGSSTQSVLENGHIETSIIQELTVVFRPKERGNLKISNIRIHVNGAEYKAPDITVTVSESNSGGGQQQGQRVQGVQKPPPSGVPFFVKAEASKSPVYKGDLVMIAYYLYRKVGIFNISVEKYPSLSGFLKDELEMPIVGGRRLNEERVIVNGVQYARALLVKYAAYPLKSGKLQLDTMEVKAGYQGSPFKGMLDEGDLFSSFFQQVAPKVSQQRSDLVNVEVIPLPDDGRPQSFSGGVGDFRISAALDKPDAKVNEPLTVRIQVEGRGNLSGIGEPKVDWPKDFEVYETKDNVKSSQSGVGVKTFEVLLIPRSGGKYTLPSIEMSFFDPVEKKYKVEKTTPMNISVTGESTIANNKGNSGQPFQNTLQNNIQNGSSLTSSEGATGDVDFSKWMPILKGFAYALLGILALIVLSLGGRVFIKFLKNRRAQPDQIFEREWKKKEAVVSRASKSTEPGGLIEGYEALAGMVFDAIDRYFSVGARSLSRAELRQVLTSQRGLSEATWQQAAQILEYSETVRFATKAGVVSASDAQGKLTSFLTAVTGFRSELQKNS